MEGKRRGNGTGVKQEVATEADVSTRKGTQTTRMLLAGHSEEGSLPGLGNVSAQSCPYPQSGCSQGLEVSPCWGLGLHWQARDGGAEREDRAPARPTTAPGPAATCWEYQNPSVYRTASTGLPLPRAAIGGGTAVGSGQHQRQVDGQADPAESASS